MTAGGDSGKGFLRRGPDMVVLTARATRRPRSSASDRGRFRTDNESALRHFAEARPSPSCRPWQRPCNTSGSARSRRLDRHRSRRSRADAMIGPHACHSGAGGPASYYSSIFAAPLAAHITHADAREPSSQPRCYRDARMARDNEVRAPSVRAFRNMTARQIRSPTQNRVRERALAPGRAAGSAPVRLSPNP